jgi:hypothetical protein
VPLPATPAERLLKRGAVLLATVMANALRQIVTEVTTSRLPIA